MNDFKIIGISTRTTNENGQSIKDVETLWNKFWNENIIVQIPNKVNEDIYAVYTDYESDYMGKYTLIIGYPVSSLNDVPNDFVGREISVGNAEKFISKGKMPEAILKTWSEIWENKKLKRAYRADVTVHGKKYFNENNTEVETFISIV